ncbi:MAG: thiamine pyrophosphate-binding protein [Actinomycetia bacterium]|nr:thiamine pyrophosphate-binding protein [Actinomycetes bacterium]
MRPPVAPLPARSLSEAGTRALFGVPGGGANLDMVGAGVEAGMQFVLAHAETPAAVMADAYAELTGSPGSCVVTRGPGAASTANGVAQAQLDRQPLVVVTDSVSPSEAGRISHQRIDQRAFFAPIAKRSMRIGHDRAEELAADAVELARTPPAGVIHLDVAPRDPSDPGPSTTRPRSSPTALAQAHELLGRSRSPVLLIGVGTRGAHEQIRRLVHGTSCPVLTTYKAKGAIPESWPNACGLLTGATIEAPVIDAADVIVGIGLDPVELIAAPWSYDAPVVLLGEWAVDADYFGAVSEVVGPLAELLPLAQEAVARSRGPAELRSGYLAQRDLLEAPVAGLAARTRSCVP